MNLKARSRILVRAFLLLVAILTVPVAAAAQTVEGTLVEEGREAPIQGALVTLLGADERPLARALTDAQGRFVLRAPAAGTYRVRADRIGFGSTTSGPLQLAEGQTAPLRLAAPGRVVQLQGIRAEARGTRRCATRPAAGAGAEVATLWEEARKALSLAEYTRQQQGWSFAVHTWRRGIDPATGVVQAESGREAEARSVDPFQSLPAADLAARGYVRADSGGVTYYSPDARVLLSDEFLAGHCFRVEEPAQAGSTLVGLAFEPVQGSRLPDVRGVLWREGEGGGAPFSGGGRVAPAFSWFGQQGKESRCLVPPLGVAAWAHGSGDGHQGVGTGPVGRRSWSSDESRRAF
jgi:hypothetical protein